MTLFPLSLSEERAAVLARSFARDGRLRIGDILAPDDAGALYRYLSDDGEWWRTLNMGEKSWDLGPESLAALTAKKERELSAAIHAQATGGFQYVYDRIRVSDDPDERRARDWPVDRFVEAMNRPETLALLRLVTGSDAISHVDGQATRYLPGQFLTAHDDAVAGKNRVAAYVLNLTPKWRSEWGGLLQFHRADGDIECGFSPGYNVLNLFRVPQMHSVSFVAPFAAEPRLAITGWLRHD
ncbi:2OG-Fe(II) oxygenase family protein [uncultured Croceicoccus sp.]|uniref:2OG-Fe(II) oxygenase family protein n=1 Tax=uncultured Croceicoccus sp. TaxID=1295329 RepID=UPI00262693C5|nr:2OG-Fe(II) oxygenase family protein [uncultured Croceicoccus sp.]